MSNEQLQAALLDVRKASRLLYDFNRRVFDIATVISESLEGYEFVAMMPGEAPLKASWSPNKRKPDFWTTLPFISTVFLWMKSEEDGALGEQVRVFGVQITADEEWLEDVPIGQWKAPDQARSIINLWLARPTRTLAKIDVKAVWDDLAGEVDWVLTPSESGDFVSVCETIDLSELPTKNEVDARVASFVARAEAILST